MNTRVPIKTNKRRWRGGRRARGVAVEVVDGGGGGGVGGGFERDF